MNVKKLWPLIPVGFLCGFWCGLAVTLLYAILNLRKEFKTDKHDKVEVDEFGKVLSFYVNELDNPPEPEKMVLFPDDAIGNQKDTQP